MVVFDSALEVLKLPVMRQQHLQSGNLGEEVRQPRLEIVMHAVEKYFTWVVTVDIITATVDDDDDPDAETTYTLSIRCRRPGHKRDTLTWTWSERRTYSSSAEVAPQTIVSFPI